MRNGFHATDLTGRHWNKKVKRKQKCCMVSNPIATHIKVVDFTISHPGLRFDFTDSAEDGEPYKLLPGDV